MEGNGALDLRHQRRAGAAALTLRIRRRIYPSCLAGWHTSQPLRLRRGGFVRPPSLAKAIPSLALYPTSGEETKKTAPPGVVVDVPENGVA